MSSPEASREEGWIAGVLGSVVALSFVAAEAARLRLGGIVVWILLLVAEVVCRWMRRADVLGKGVIRRQELASATCLGLGEHEQASDRRLEGASEMKKLGTPADPCLLVKGSGRAADDVGTSLSAHEHLTASWRSWKGTLLHEIRFPRWRWKTRSCRGASLERFLAWRLPRVLGQIFCA